MLVYDAQHSSHQNFGNTAVSPNLMIAKVSLDTVMHVSAYTEKGHARAFGMVDVACACVDCTWYAGMANVIHTNPIVKIIIPRYAKGIVAIRRFP